MAETISMNKVIHGAVRRDLQRFLDALAAFSDGDACPVVPFISLLFSARGAALGASALGAA